MKSFKLSRRAMLVGTGAAIALPVLDAMLDGKGFFHGTAGAQTLTSPQRLFTFFFPGGCDLTAWHPTTTGRSYQLPDSLTPLATHKGDITVLSGIDLAVPTGLGDGHGRGIGCFATAAPLTATASTGTSVDQVAQEELGRGKRSLVLGVTNKPGSGQPFGGITNTSDVYNEISWSVARGGVVQSVRDPAAVFDSLFGSGPVTNEAADRARRYEQSVLSYVRADTTRLQSRLGAADRQRLDAHLTAIRDLEVGIAMASNLCAPPVRPGRVTDLVNSGYSTQKLRQMIDLIAIAMACDLSRFGSLMISGGSGNGGSANHQIVGCELDEHSAAHDGEGPVRRYDQIRIYKRYHMTQLNYLLDKLASYREPGGTVLDNSVIFVGSELADPVAHNHENIPVLLCGKAGGRLLSAGSCVKFTKQPVGNVLLTALRAVGSNAPSIGNSTGVLPGLLAG